MSVFLLDCNFFEFVLTSPCTGLIKAWFQELHNVTDGSSIMGQLCFVELQLFFSVSQLEQAACHQLEYDMLAKG